MSRNKVIMIFAALMLAVNLVSAQDKSQGSSEKTIQHSTIKTTSPASGKEMFKAYCAVCHGVEGKGDGPAASALKIPPANLTLLSKNNGGKFPAMKVNSTIRGTADLPAHGSKDMPVWGPLFWGMSHGHDSEVEQRVANLTRYIETLQEK